MFLQVHKVFKNQVAIIEISFPSIMSKTLLLIAVKNDQRLHEVKLRPSHYTFSILTLLLRLQLQILPMIKVNFA